HAADARIAIIAQHAQHVAMQVRDTAISLDTGNRQEESSHTAAVEGSQSLAPDTRGDDEQAHGQQLQIVETPDDPLQFNGFGKLRVSRERADVHIPLRLASCPFASCQRSSISSTVASFNDLPCA